MGMINILQKEEAYDFIFGKFDFNNEEIDESIFSYDVRVEQLILFGTRVSLFFILIDRVT
jgi:hypothetical protein